MKMLFAVDRNWSIGYEGDLLIKISKDLKRFRKFTEENIIIMGRKTFESLPNKKALPNRINIVITRDEKYKADDILVVNSVEELFPLLEKLNPNKDKGEFLIGGGNIARQMLKHCNKAYITKINKSFDKFDTSMPNLDKDEEWKIVKESEKKYQDDLEYKYVDYVRIK